ncbi:FAD-binding PCMH-type domain-containing protein [Mycena venus]|uniref:D-arabinono-1,4-lactone oxidase n=1 Tax=Mycena venus TaxID=2733690 RepID=A0A8H6Y372_9AGAR|nr:FAD-binding PCMH-type domain-containing protein [Mycena venus]
MATTSTEASQRQDADSILASITIPSTSPRSKFVNWGLSYECQPLAIFEPENERHCELVLEFARREGRVLRAVGVGHSPSDLACTGDFMLKMTKLNKLLEVNLEKLYVVVQAGITLTDLHVELGKHGLAMRNLGSISDQTLGGIVTTASHGSGIGYQVMSADVTALTLLLADGSRVTCSRQERTDLFMASLCGLGATGIILTVQLEVERAFRLKDVQCSRTFEDVIGHLDELVRSAQYVRFWWIAATHTVKCSVVNRTQEPKLPPIPWFWSSLLAFHVVQFLLFLGRYIPYVNTLTGRFVAWLSSGNVTLIDDSHTIFNVECRQYPQHTTEWAIPFKNAQTCLRDLHDWMDKEAADPNGIRPHFPFELRFSAQDDIWLSPSYGQETCWIGIAQYKPYGFNVPYRRFFAGYEAIVARHGGRPHWAKAHHYAPDTLRKLYPHFDDFVRLIHEVDPDGIFRNEYVRRHVLGEGVGERVFKGRLLE